MPPFRFHGEPYPWHQLIFSSQVYGHYSNIFDWAYGLPLFLEGSPVPHVSHPDSRADFCMTMRPQDGCCSRCPLLLLPPLGMLEPWVWDRPCGAGFGVIFAPIRSGSKSYAWLVTGHHGVEYRKDFKQDVANALTRCGMARLISEATEEQYAAVPLIKAHRHQQAGKFMHLAGEMIGAEMNGLLLARMDGDSPETAALKKRLQMREVVQASGTLESLFTQETGMSSSEFYDRCRIEEARRTILGGKGTESEIQEAGIRAGYVSDPAFQQMFQQFFFETPKEHFDRMENVRAQLWDGTSFIEEK